MKVLIVLLGSLYLILCVGLIIVVMLQESKQRGVSGITGDSAEIFSKGKGGMKKEAFYSRLTVMLSVFFAVLSIILSVLIRTYQG